MSYMKLLKPNITYTSKQIFSKSTSKQIRSHKKRIRSYKKQTKTNYENKISDKAGDYSSRRQHSLKFTRAAETFFPITPIRTTIIKLVK